MNREMIEKKMSETIAEIDQEFKVYLENGNVIAYANMRFLKGHMAGYLAALKDVGEITPAEAYTYELELDNKFSKFLKNDKKDAQT